MSTIKRLRKNDFTDKNDFIYTFSLVYSEVRDNKEVMFINMVIIINTEEEKGVVMIDGNRFDLNETQCQLIYHWFDPENDLLYINDQRLYWMTPLILFTKLNHVYIVKYLLSQGCSPNVEVSLKNGRKISVLNLKISNKSSIYISLLYSTNMSKDVCGLISDF